MFQLSQPQSTPFDEIECDPPRATMLCVSFPADVSALAASIRRVGLLQPVVLARGAGGEKHRVVCGMRRLVAVRSLGWKDVPARMLSADVTAEQAALLSVEDNLSRGLSAVEVAIAIEKLRAFGWSRRRLVQEFLPLVGLPPSERHLDRLVALRSFPDAVLREIHAGDVDVAVSELFTDLSDADRRALIALLFERVRLSLGASRDVIDCLRKLAGQRGTDIAAVLEDEEIRKTLAADMPARRKGEALRALLRRKTMPTFSATKTAFEETARSASFGEKVSVMPSRYFEKDEITISIRATTSAEARSAAESILRAEESGVFEKLFRIVQGANAGEG